MAGVLNTLYPPVLSSWVPAFVASEGVTIQYDIADYQVSDDYDSIEYSLRFNSSNKSALVGRVDYLEAPKTEDRTLRITNDVLDGGAFVVNQFYKLQIRFVKNNAHSEWSTICLLKPVPQIQTNINQFDGDADNYTFYSRFPKFTGSVKFESSTDEYISSVVVKLYEGADAIIDVDGNERECLEGPENIVLSKEDNGYFEYFFKNDLQDRNTYQFVYKIVTNNGYTKEESKIFSTNFSIKTGSVFMSLNSDSPYEQDKKWLSAFSEKIQKQETKPVYSFSEEYDEVEGGIRIILGNTEVINEDLNTVIRRRVKGDSKWEIVYEEMVYWGSPEEEVVSLIDTTVQPGVEYEYEMFYTDTINYYVEANSHDIQKINLEEGSYYLNGAVVSKNGKNYICQLKVKYNPEITSFKYTIGDSVTNTLGGKYPFIRRNGAMRYRQFQMSGMITYHGNGNLYFKGIFDDENAVNKYKTVKKDSLQNEISGNPYKTITDETFREKEFRDAVIEFLHDGKPKLFRSNTEGNMLVRLVDVNLTPITNLGRTVYSFSATAYEIDEYNVENCKKYNIVLANTKNNKSKIENQFLTQFSGNFGVNDDFITFAEQKYKNSTHFGYENQVTVKYLKYESNNFIADGEKPHAVYINDTLITIPPNGYYELNGEDMVITSVKPAQKEENLIVLLGGFLNEIPNNKSRLRPKQISSETIVGMIDGTFAPGEEIFDGLQQKYNYAITSQTNMPSDNNSGQSTGLFLDNVTKLTKILGIEIEAAPGTIFIIDDLETVEEHEMNFTGILRLFLKSASSQSNYIKSIKIKENILNKAPSDTYMIRTDEFRIVESPELITRERDYCDGKILINNKIYDAILQDDNHLVVQQPIPVTIKYIAEIQNTNYDSYIDIENEEGDL